VLAVSRFGPTSRPSVNFTPATSRALAEAGFARGKGQRDGPTQSHAPKTANSVRRHQPGLSVRALRSKRPATSHKQPVHPERGTVCRSRQLHSPRNRRERQTTLESNHEVPGSGGRRIGASFGQCTASFETLAPRHKHAPKGVTTTRFRRSLRAPHGCATASKI
jgi:hypothetical protein